jgi:hypothetical protein
MRSRRTVCEVGLRLRESREETRIRGKRNGAPPFFVIGPTRPPSPSSLPPFPSVDVADGEVDAVLVRERERERGRDGER